MKVGDLVKNLQTPAHEDPLLGLIVSIEPGIDPIMEFFVVKWMGRYNGQTSLVSEEEVGVVNEDR